MNDTSERMQFFLLITLAFFCLGGIAGLYALRWESRYSCEPSARWISDATIQRAGTVRCDGQKSMTIQSAMDGYIVLCSCP